LETNINCFFDSMKPLDRVCLFDLNLGKLKKIICCAQIIFIKDLSNPIPCKNSISPQCCAVIFTVYISFKIQFFTLSASLYRQQPLTRSTKTTTSSQQQLPLKITSINRWRVCCVHFAQASLPSSLFLHVPVLSLLRFHRVHIYTCAYITMHIVVTCRHVKILIKSCTNVHSSITLTALHLKHSKEHVN